MRDEGNTELLQELQDRLDHPPKFWCPEGVREGLEPSDCLTADRVAGVVQTIEDRENDYGPYRSVVVSCADGSRVKVAGIGAVLSRRFDQLRLGDGLAIRFKGRVAPKTPGYGPYLDYQVERIAAEPEDDAGEVVLAAVPDEEDEPQTGEDEPGVSDDPASWAS
jgi:hypothetical protein